MAERDRRYRFTCLFVDEFRRRNHPSTRYTCATTKTTIFSLASLLDFARCVLSMLTKNRQLLVSLKVNIYPTSIDRPPFIGWWSCRCRWRANTNGRSPGRSTINTNSVAHAKLYNSEDQFSFCTRNTADKSKSQIGLNRDQQAVSFRVWRICRRLEKSSAKRMRNSTNCLRNSIHCLRSHFSLTLVFTVLTAQATWLMQQPQRTPIWKNEWRRSSIFAAGLRPFWHASFALASMRPCDVAARVKRHVAALRWHGARRHTFVFFFSRACGWNSCRRGV